MVKLLLLLLNAEKGIVFLVLLFSNFTELATVVNNIIL